MKKIIIIVLLFPFLIATQCEEEPCLPIIKQRNKPNLITVENLQSTYNVGDILWINSTLERNQAFDNPNETIDLFDYPLDFEFGLQFYKLSVYNPEIYLCLNENTTVITNGSLNTCNLFVYEKIANTLKCRIGIKLLEPGNYKISIFNIATFRNSGLTCDDQGLDIYTTFSNDNLQNINFTVQ
jgi:hypothetical protein